MSGKKADRMSGLPPSSTKRKPNIEQEISTSISGNNSSKGSGKKAKLASSLNDAPMASTSFSPGGKNSAVAISDALHPNSASSSVAKSAGKDLMVKIFNPRDSKQAIAYSFLSGLSGSKSSMEKLAEASSLTGVDLSLVNNDNSDVVLPEEQSVENAMKKDQLKLIKKQVKKKLRATDKRKIEFDDDVANMKKKSKQEVADLKQKFDEDLAVLKQKFDKDVATLKQKCGSDVAALKQNYEDDIAGCMLRSLTSLLSYEIQRFRALQL
uniref:Uncharacterized protein n=1 Tax=Ditylenchus dipsaci TaxID=166011 RepID=A0A915D1Y3_9BILA